MVTHVVDGPASQTLILNLTAVINTDLLSLSHYHLIRRDPLGKFFTLTHTKKKNLNFKRRVGNINSTV